MVNFSEFGHEIWFKLNGLWFIGQFFADNEQTLDRRKKTALIPDINIYKTHACHWACSFGICNVLIFASYIVPKISWIMQKWEIPEKKYCNWFHGNSYSAFGNHYYESWLFENHLKEYKLVITHHCGSQFILNQKHMHWAPSWLKLIWKAVANCGLIMNNSWNFVMNWIAYSLVLQVGIFCYSKRAHEFIMANLQIRILILMNLVQSVCMPSTHIYSMAICVICLWYVNHIVQLHNKCMRHASMWE